MEEREKEREIYERKFPKKKLDFDTDEEDDYGMLGLGSGYALEEMEPTLEEMEIKEEEDLNNQIEKLNLNSKEKLKDQNKSSKLLSSPISNGRISTTEDESPIISLKFVEQNVINYNKKIKLLLIGKKMSGKTSLINKVISQNSENSSDLSYNYIPTTSINFYKTNLYMDFTNIQIEFIDTNENISNSIMIKTYYQLSNGVIFIIKDLKEEIPFIQKQIEKLISISKSPNIFLFFNKVDGYDSNNYSFVQQNLIEKYNIKYYLISDLESLNIKEEEAFEEYLRQTVNSN